MTSVARGAPATVGCHSISHKLATVCHIVKTQLQGSGKLPRLLFSLFRLWPWPQNTGFSLNSHTTHSVVCYLWFGSVYMYVEGVGYTVNSCILLLSSFVLSVVTGERIRDISVIQSTDSSKESILYKPNLGNRKCLLTESLKYLWFWNVSFLTKVKICPEKT